MRAHILQAAESLGVALVAASLGWLLHPALGVALAGAYVVLLANQWR